MPIKGMSPKNTMRTEMHKFKVGKLHSGSKEGPKVKSRKEAIAIGLSEARRARRPGHGGPDPVERSVAAADVTLPHRAFGDHYDQGFVEYLPKLAQGESTRPKKLGAYPAPLNPNHRLKPMKDRYEPYEPPTHHVQRAESHGYGHRESQQEGHLRQSGDPRAHQIGRK